MSANRRAVLALGLLPFAPFVVALITYAPVTGPGIVSLAGTWTVLNPEANASLDANSVEAASVKAEVPGPLPGLVREILIARTFDVDPSHAAESHLLVFGGVSNGVAGLFVNGHPVGEEGVRSTGYKLEHVGLSAFFVDSALLKRGRNVVSALISPENDTMASIHVALVDRRLMIGPYQTMRPWFDAVLLLSNLLELGGALLLFFVTGLVLVLSAAERDRAARMVQWTAAALSLAMAAYLAGKSGIPMLIMPGDRGLVPKSISAMGFLLPELLERALLARVSRIQRVNRWICGVHIVLQFFISSAWIYRIFIPYLFVLLSYGAALGLREVVRKRNVETVMLVGCMVAMVFAGANDLLTDLNVLSNPRLFVLAAVDMAVVGAVFVVARFLRTMTENTHLLLAAEGHNKQLSIALERAEESTRMKSAFLANTSHELRTPLNSIINVPEGLLEEFVQRTFIVCGACGCIFDCPEGYIVADGQACPECKATGTLKTELRPVFAGDPDAAMRYLRAIQSSGRHLLAVVSDILDFSKLEAGRMELHAAPARVDAIFERLGLAMEPLAASRGIRLKVGRLPPEEELVVDDVKLTQVVMNLVSNAIKFSPDGSTVEVRPVLDATKLTVEVIDRGTGIAPADQARIFESFLQLDNSHTRKVGGTGLGLAITKKIVELMGGSIRVASVLQEGSTFTVELPRAPPSPVAQPPA